MKLLVCGSREWKERTVLYEVLDTEHRAQPITLLIEGEAPGADVMAAEWALARGVMLAWSMRHGKRVRGFPAQWDRFKRAAGPMRNTEMLRALLLHRDAGLPCRVIAFHNNISESSGTKDMLRQARREHITCHLISFDPTSGVTTTTIANQYLLFK